MDRDTPGIQTHQMFSVSKSKMALKHQRSPTAGDWSLSLTEFDACERISEHAHGPLSLSIIFSGGYTETFPGGAIETRPYTAVIKPPGLVHGNVMSTAGLQALYAEPRATMWESLAPDLRVMDRPVFIEGGRVTTSVHKLRLRVSKDGDGLTAAADDALVELLAEAATIWRFQVRSTRQTWLERVRDRLHDGYVSGVTIAELARVAEVHPVHVVQSFRARFGCSIGDYVRRLRVEHAARLLQGRLPISRIAAEAGFADHSHLARTFRRAVGMTPTAYRDVVRCHTM